MDWSNKRVFSLLQLLTGMVIWNNYVALCKKIYVIFTNKTQDLTKCNILHLGLYSIQNLIHDES